MRNNSISHGDLQDGNIVIDENENIKLIDYDSICIPEIEGQKELVTGLKGYQHPSRFVASTCSTKADYFSVLIIYLSVLAFAENPELWNKYKVNDTEVFLFTQNDFSEFSQSEIKADLDELSPSIKFLTNILEKYLEETNYNNLVPFDTYFQHFDASFEKDRFIATNSENYNILNRVGNAHTVVTNNSMGKVSDQGSPNVNHIQNVSPIKVEAISPKITRKPFKLFFLLFPTILLIATLAWYIISRDSINPPHTKGLSSENLEILTVADNKFKEYINCINRSVDSLIAVTSDSLRLIDIRTFKDYKENAIDMRYTLKMASVTQYDSLSFRDYTENLISDMEKMAIQYSIQLPNCPL